MRSRKTQNKIQNKLLFCKLCSFVTTNSEELDLHYKLSHELNDDISTELEIAFESKKINQKKPKTLKDKAIKQLELQK